MAKFKMRLKLTGLEIEVEGDRQDAEQISRALNSQLGGLLAPTTNLVAPSQPDGKVIDVDTTTSETPPPNNRKRRKPSGGTNKSAGTDTAEALEFRNDISKWGSPKQDWTTSDKSLWFLYIATQQTPHKELSAATIASSFNKLFRQAGSIRASNVSRDLGNLKTKKKPAWVNEDVNGGRSKWFLTDEGVRNAEILVAQAKGDNPGAPQ